MEYSICKVCGSFYHDSIIWKNNCRCPHCGSNEWMDG